MIDKFAYGRYNDINEICDFKKIETYSLVIQSLVRTTNCKFYLELGVADGKNIHMIRDYVEYCVGVDVKDICLDKDKIFYNLMSTDEFFEKNIFGNFDIIFIDANHDWIYVRRDFENSLKILNEFGLIILHDTDPIHNIMLQKDYCSDSYHINDYIYANHKDLDVITLPVCDMGLTLVKRKKDTRISKIL